MAQTRYYSSIAVEMQLDTGSSLPSGDSAGTSRTIVLKRADGGTGSLGLPTSYPFTLIVDPDTSTEEIVTVTATTGTNTYTVTRGSDSSLISAHSIAAIVRHGVSARDYDDSRKHENATTGGTLTVHGLTTGDGDFVATTKSQTLTNKTLTSPTINTPIITTPTVSNGTFTTPTITTPAVTDGTISGSATISTTGSITTTGTITGGTINATTKFQLNGSDVKRFAAGVATSISFTSGAASISWGSTLSFTPSSVVLTPVLGSSALTVGVDTSSLPTTTGTGVKAFNGTTAFTGSLSKLYWVAYE